MHVQQYLVFHIVKDFMVKKDTENRECRARVGDQSKDQGGDQGGDPGKEGVAVDRLPRQAYI